MRRVRRTSVAGIAIAGVVALAACGSDDGDSASSGALPVVATTTVVADIVENVGGDDVEVTTLVGREADAHTFEPEPSDSVSMADAALVFEIGRGFEEWLDSAIEASGGDAQVVSLSESVEAIEAGEDSHSDESGEAHSDDADKDEAGHSEDEEGHSDDEAAHSEDEEGHSDDEAAHSEDEEGHSDDEAAHSEDEHGHSHSGEDPHVWMTAANGILMTEAVADALAEADPDNADAYAERAAAYESELAAAGTEIAATLDALAPNQRVLFTNHDAFGYFAAEYDFEVLGSALGSFTTEGADPSAADVAAIVGEIEEAGVPAIFPENIANSDTLEAIATEAGVEVGPVLATGALGEEGSDSETYVGLLTSNANSIATALGS